MNGKGIRLKLDDFRIDTYGFGIQIACSKSIIIIQESQIGSKTPL